MMRDLEALMSATLALLVSLLFLTGIGVIGWQGYQWLSFGVWPSCTVLEAFTQLGVPLPYASWVGVQSMVDWWLATPASINLFVLGLITGGLGFSIISVDAVQLRQRRG
jgi:hypothetical protein